MKTIKKFTLLSILIIAMIITSCVEDDDFVTPNIEVTTPDVSSFGDKTNFNAVVSRYLVAVGDGESVGVFTSEENDLYIEGYVISSDEAGNFYEELIIQNSIDANDAGTDPRRGFNVQINASSLSDTYELGRKVYIKLNGLAIGIENGVYTIGKAVGNTLEQIQDFEYKNFIVRDTVVATLTPKISVIADLTEQDENTLIQLDNMQINKNQLSLTYAGEPSDEFDGFRNIENCDNLGCGGGVLLQTSTFADYKSVQVPQGRGSIQGIFSRDFGDDFNVFIINSTADISFDNTTRCDPEVLTCTGTTSATQTVFLQDFQTITNESQLDGLGWTNVNVSGGSERFEDSSFSGDRYMKISAFGTGENPLEAWLVTPAINLDGTSQEELSFEISASFESGKILSAYITDNYTGDPNTTVWLELDANIPVGDSGFGSFVQSTINISCLSGDVHVAFKYCGAADGAETRYHVDDIKVTGMN